MTVMNTSNSKYPVSIKWGFRRFLWVMDFVGVALHHLLCSFRANLCATCFSKVLPVFNQIYFGWPLPEVKLISRTECQWSFPDLIIFELFEFCSFPTWRLVQIWSESVCTSGWVGKVTDLNVFGFFNFVVFPPDDWYRFDPNLSVPVAG